MLLISIFHLYQPIDDDILVFFRPVLFSQTVSAFSDDKLLLQFLVLMDDVSGYLRPLGTPGILQRGQLQFSGMFLV